MSETHYDSKTKMLGGFPKIKKLGAVSPNGESTPFVWNNRLMRLELDDATNGVDSEYRTSAVIRDRETGEIISRFGEGCYYFSFYQENGTAYVLSTKSENGMLCGNTIMLYESKDLKNWTCRPLIYRNGWQFFNSSLTKGENGYVLLLEFGPHPFSYTFATSPDMVNWTFMPDDCIFGKDRYVGGPWMKYRNGWYYVIAVEELPAARYTNYIYRTKDFKDWQSGYYNPLFMPSEDDRIISPCAFDLSDELKEQIRTGFISSNSDIDMCDWNGKTLFTYNAGNQLGFYFLAEAEYDGCVADFLESNFR